MFAVIDYDVADREFPVGETDNYSGDPSRPHRLFRDVRTHELLARGECHYVRFRRVAPGVSGDGGLNF